MSKDKDKDAQGQHRQRQSEDKDKDEDRDKDVQFRITLRAALVYNVLQNFLMLHFSISTFTFALYVFTQMSNCLC